MFFFRVFEQLLKSKVEFAVVGGYAVALYGAVRGTVDLDIVVKMTEKNFVAVENALKGLGLLPKLPVSAIEVFRFRDEYIRNRNLVAWSFANVSKPSEIVDIIVTQDLEKLKVVKMSIGDLKIPVISIDDLIKMKTSSARPQDLEDVRALKKLKK